MTYEIIGNVVSALTATIVTIIFYCKKPDKKSEIESLKNEIWAKEQTEKTLRDYITQLLKPKPVIKDGIETLADVGEAVKITQEQIADLLTNLHKNFPKEMTPLIDEIKVKPHQSFYEIRGYFVNITFKF